MKTILDRMSASDKKYFEVTYADQKKYLDELGEAKNDLDRSFKQYKGQVYLMPKYKPFLLNFASFFLITPLIFYFTFRGVFERRHKPVKSIGRQKDCDQFVPDSLIKRYNINREVWWKTSCSLSITDSIFVFSLVLKYILHPYFLTKSVYKIAKYSALIQKYSPDVIIVNDEFSFTSSLLTKLCENHNVRHINVMHGEKFYYIRDSFFRYHECYVWNEYYRDLLISLKAESSQFRIEMPLSMKFNMGDYKSPNDYADFKYYLAIYNEKEIISIVESMKFAKNQGKKVKFRPHPHYSDINLLRKYVDEEEIELPSLNILVSVANCEYAVGSFSTVLSQAYFNGGKVILDDVTYKSRFDALVDVKYILASRVKNKLSIFQKGN